MLAMPLAMLDSTTVSTALPTILGELGGLAQLASARVDHRAAALWQARGRVRTQERDAGRDHLSQAAREADYLIVGVNSDASTKRLKGPSRPVNDEQSRALVLASLLMVDAVVIFEEDTPLELITSLMPDVLVKGGDYTVEQVAGSKEVIANGGRVVINAIVEGFSTTGIIQKVQR